MDAGESTIPVWLAYPLFRVDMKGPRASETALITALTAVIAVLGLALLAAPVGVYMAQCKR